MAAQNDLPDVRLDPTSLYREEVFTDRRAGTHPPPDARDGGRRRPIPARPVLFSGQTQLLTPAGVLPLAFEIEAKTLEEALREISGGREGGAGAGDR